MMEIILRSIKKLLPLIILGLLTLFALRALILNPFYTSHDSFTHTARIASYFQSIREGQWPPWWARNFNGGMGSPIFNYIYPLPYLFGSLVHFIGFSFQDSYRLVVGISTIFSALGMYLWLRKEFDKTMPALVGAVFYIWVPYRFLNLYVRGAYAENMAYAFLPFVFLSVRMIFSSKNRLIWWPMFVLLTSGLLLTHNQIAAIFIPIIISWALIVGLAEKKVKFFASLLLGVMVAGLVSAFIYFPDFLDRSLVRFDKSISYYQDHYVAWWQLIRSPWGYGFDFPDTDKDAMSLQIGLTQIGVLVVSFFGFLFAFFKQKKKLQKNSLEWSAGFFIGFSLIVIGLMIKEPYVQIIWKMIPMLTTIVDFPWRFLGVVSFSCSVLAGYLVYKFRIHKIVGVVLVCGVLFFNRNHLNINLPQDFSDSVFSNFKGTSTATSNEFTPSSHITQSFFDVKAPVEIVVGDANISILKNSPQILRFIATGRKPFSVRINRFHFPDTRIYKDGRLLIFNKDYIVIYELLDKYNDDTGLIRINSQDGGGEYTVYFSETQNRRVGNVVSTVSCVFVILILLFGLIRKYKDTRKLFSSR